MISMMQSSKQNINPSQQMLSMLFVKQMIQALDYPIFDNTINITQVQYANNKNAVKQQHHKWVCKALIPHSAYCRINVACWLMLTFA
jgi:hypothetical protein